MPSHDWKSLSGADQAFAIYMGLGNAGDHLRRGCSMPASIPQTPVTIVENGTLANERIFTTPIGGL